MNRPVLLLAPILVAALAACSGSSDADEPSTLASSAPATEPAATSAPDATVAPTTSTTTTTSTTVAPTTTVDPIVEIADQIAASFIEGERATILAFADPASTEAEAILAQHHAEGVLDGLLDSLREARDEGLRGKANPDVPQVNVLLELPRVVESQGETRANVRTCRVDAGIIFRPSVVEGGEDIIVNDVVRRIIAESEFLLDEGVWKLSGGSVLQNEVGVTTCDGV